jgi:hypothetical protein
MADKLHLRLANHTDVANDDPFAELTRIMGFDPRKASGPATQAEPAAPAPASASPEDAFDELDFSIDLEKELLGDFAHDGADAPVSAAANWDRPAHYEQPAQDEFEPAAPAAISDPFFSPVEEASADAGWLDDVSTNAASSHLDDLDAELEQAFDLGSFADQGSSEDLGSIDGPTSVEDRVSFRDHDDFERKEASFIPYAANDIPAPIDTAPIDDVDASFDDLADIAFDPEELTGLSAEAPAQAEMHDIGDHTSELYAADPLDFGPADADAHNLDSQFDTALADVDFGFGAVDDRAEQQDLAVAAQGDLDRELDLSLDEGFASALPVEAPAAVAAADHEMSLEDELNALLGNSAPSRPAPVLAEAAPAYVPYVPPVAAVATQPLAFARDVSDPAANYAVDARATAFSDDRLDEVAPKQKDFAADYQDDAPVSQHAEPEFNLDFDDADFDAALSQSAVADRGNESGYGAPAMTSVEPAQAAADAINPYAALAALSATLKPSRSFASPEVAQQPVAARPEPSSTVYDFAPTYADEEANQPVDAASDAYVPDIDTYDVPEHAVALADDLDLPEFAFEDEPVAAPAYDDIDAEYTSLLNGMNSADVPAPAQATAAPQEERIDLARGGADRDGPAIFAGVPYPAPSMPAAAAQARTSEQAWNAPGNLSDDIYSDMRSAVPAGKTADPDLSDMEFAYDPDLDEDISVPAYAPIEQRKAPRRGMMIAAVVGGVALLGGVGALALSWGGGTGASGPVLVKADDQPVKVKPENPGGTTIPNQDNKVYDTVAGGSVPVDPKQDALVSTEEEPVDLPPPVDEAADVADADATAEAAAVPPSQKAEDRVEQDAQDAGVDKSMEVAAVAPRKVRTMIVKADGTLVAREDPAPAPAQATEDATAVMTAPVPSATPTTTGTVDAAAEQPTDVASAPAAEDTLPIATAPVEEPALAPASKPTEDAPVTQQSSVTPQKAPVAPARPAEQPVNVVGEVKADKVAALSPAAAAPAGAWAMQIASQPTEEAAKASYQDLARRYGSVLEGRQVSVVKAEISGKGTFWRVRVAANSRNEAVSLCESYKSAGGNCFVSK